MKMRSYDDVWQALEQSTGQAANMRVRADLMIAVQSYVRTGKLTQTEAARKLGVSQPRLNNLLRGRIDKFSLDALVNMLASAGRQVTVKVRKAA